MAEEIKNTDQPLKSALKSARGNPEPKMQKNVSMSVDLDVEENKVQ